MDPQRAGITTRTNGREEDNVVRAVVLFSCRERGVEANEFKWVVDMFRTSEQRYPSDRKQAAIFLGASVTGLSLAFPVHLPILRHVSLLDMVDDLIAALGLTRLFLDIEPGLAVRSRRSGQGAG